MPPRKSPAFTGIPGAEHGCLLVDDCQHVAGGQDQVLLAVVLDLGAAVLAVDDGVALGDVQRDALLAVLIPAAGTDSDHGAFLRLLLGGVGDDQTGSGRGLGLVGLYEDLVLEWLDVHARHDWSPPLVGVSIRGTRMPHYQVFGKASVPPAVVAGAGGGVGRLPPSTLYTRVLALKGTPLPGSGCRSERTAEPRLAGQATWPCTTGRPGSLAASSGDGAAPAAIRCAANDAI